jgi:hypothetical protein
MSIFISSFVYIIRKKERITSSNCLIYSRLIHKKNPIITNGNRTELSENDTSNFTFIRNHLLHCYTSHVCHVVLIFLFYVKEWIIKSKEDLSNKIFHAILTQSMWVYSLFRYTKWIIIQLTTICKSLTFIISIHHFMNPSSNRVSCCSMRFEKTYHVRFNWENWSQVFHFGQINWNDLFHSMDSILTKLIIWNLSIYIYRFFRLPIWIIYTLKYGLICSTSSCGSCLISFSQ